MFITVLLLFFISSPSTSNETSQIINQIKQTTNTFTHNDKINNVKQVHKILALVGIFSTWDRFHRRSLIRTTYMTARPDNLKIVFVFGKPINDTVRGLLELEQNAYNDVMILDINENMDNGKTYHYFKHVAALYNNDAPTFVMKTDGFYILI